MWQTKTARVKHTCWALDSVHVPVCYSSPPICEPWIKVLENGIPKALPKYFNMVSPGMLSPQL